MPDIHLSRTNRFFRASHPTTAATASPASAKATAKTVPLMLAHPSGGLCNTRIIRHCREDANDGTAGRIGKPSSIRSPL